jgi:hypothetical protein
MNITKPILLFAGYSYYPSGGMLDFQGAFEDEDAARAFVDEHNANVSYGGQWNWHHFTDVRTLLETE